MLKNRWTTVAVLLLAAALALLAGAQESPAVAEFLGEVPALTATEDGNLLWESTKLKGPYNSLIVVQPEIYLHPDSKKGFKPDQMAALADAFKDIFATRVADQANLVDQAGPNVAFVRFAIVDVYLKKKGRGLFGFTPLGAVTHAVKNAAGKNINLIEATIVGEALDSQTGERIAVLVTKKGQHKDKEKKLKEDKTSWDEVEKELREMAEFTLARMEWLRQMRQAP